MSAPTVYTVDEAAAATGLSGDQLRAAIRRGDVPAERRGQRYLLSRETVEDLRGEPPAQNNTGGKTQMITDTDNTDAWPLGRRGLTAEELADFRALWNQNLAPLGRKGLEARGFWILAGVHMIHLDWPLRDDRSCTLTVISPAIEQGPGDALAPIPDNVEIEGVAVVYEPEASSAA